MRLRKLEPRDAEGMLNWMSDPSISQYFRFSKDSATLESVNNYINQAQSSEKDMHLAIADDDDNYVGTISLKSIDPIARNAEYAISTCAQVHGTGIALEATKEILRIAFKELNLHRVYLNVLADNGRANHFYKKCGFVYEGRFREHVNIRGELKDLNWYSMLSTEFSDEKSVV